jgi:hypothetical protein
MFEIENLLEESKKRTFQLSHGEVKESQLIVSSESFGPTFTLENHIPESWSRIIDTRSRIVWRFENTILVQLIGAENTRRFLYLGFGNSILNQLMHLLLLGHVILVLLGFCQYIPEVAQVPIAVGQFLLYVYIHIGICDVSIASRVCVNMNTGMSLFFSILGAVCFAFMDGWTLRGWAAVIVFPSMTTATNLQDSTPFRARITGALMGNCIQAIFFFTTAVLVNTGKAIGLDTAYILFRVSVSLARVYTLPFCLPESIQVGI